MSRERPAAAGLHTSGTLEGEVTAENRAAGTTPTLRVGDRDAPGEPCVFGRACIVWSSVLGLPQGVACERVTAEGRPEAVRVKPPKERAAARSFGHPEGAQVDGFSPRREMPAGDGEGHRDRAVGFVRPRRCQLVQKVEQVVGMGAGHVQANGEGPRSIALEDTLQSPVQEGIAGSRLGKSQLGGGGLEILRDEDGEMALAGGVHADADASP